MQLPRSLEIALSERKVVPFVGAGLSRGVLDPKGTPLFPTWPELLEGASRELAAEGKEDDAQLVASLVKKKDLLEAAKRAQAGLMQPRWVIYLKGAFDREYEEADPSTLATLQKIWAIGSNLVITTNYDRSLQWVCPNRADFSVWDIEAKAEQITAIREGAVSRPTLWHLHGRIDNASEIILTPAGYANLYGDKAAEGKYGGALDTLQTLLKSRTLLFVGFSMTDADFMAQVLKVNQKYDGAAGQHYALLRRGEGDERLLEQAGVEPVFYDAHEQVGDILTAMSMQPQKSLQAPLKKAKYTVGRDDGLHMFGGRGDEFFELYDAALAGIDSQLDIFSLKLSRFRQNQKATILGAAARTRIRIALLDPAFPLPADHVSLASIREREEGAIVGAIRRDVAAWATVYEEYRRAVDNGAMVETPETGLHIRLYNILPTVNLFRVDANLFVGPYLLEVEDRHTPTFLIQSSGQPNTTMGTKMFDVYCRHFEAVWNNSGTRSIEAITEAELASWREGRGQLSA